MKPRRKADLQLSDIPATGESILLDPESGKATVLNEMATIVWLLCDGTRDAVAICREIASTRPDLGVDAAALRADVERILAELLAEGVVA